MRSYYVIKYYTNGAKENYWDSSSKSPTKFFEELEKTKESDTEGYEVYTYSEYNDHIRGRNKS